MIKLNQASVSKEISSIRTNGQGLKQSNGNVNLSKTNLVTFKEYVNMFEDYQSAISNYENIIEQDTDGYGYNGNRKLLKTIEK